MRYQKGRHIVAFGEAWVCTPKAFKEIQAILLSIYGPKEEKGGVEILDKKGMEVNGI